MSSYSSIYEITEEQSCHKFHFQWITLVCKAYQVIFIKNVKSLGILKNSIDGHFCQVYTAILTKLVPT